MQAVNLRRIVVVGWRAGVNIFIKYFIFAFDDLQFLVQLWSVQWCDDRRGPDGIMDSFWCNYGRPIGVMTAEGLMELWAVFGAIMVGPVV